LNIINFCCSSQAIHGRCGGDIQCSRYLGLPHMRLKRRFKEILSESKYEQKRNELYFQKKKEDFINVCFNLSFRIVVKSIALPNEFFMQFSKI